MDLIRSTKKRRSIILELLHAVFNIAFAAAILGLILWFPNNIPWIASLLVLLSKWRIFTVRFRHWWANILSNLPDLLLGIGIVILMWQAGAMVANSLPVQIALTVFYAIWLVYLKPQHKKHFVMIQSGLSQFIAISALFVIGYLLPVWVVIILTFIIGFASARQVFGLFQEKDKALLSMIWGLIVAQLSFVAWHWTIAYQIAPGLKIPAFAIIISLIGFSSATAYKSYKKHTFIRGKDVKLPITFSVIAILIIIFLFSGLWDATAI